MRTPTGSIYTPREGGVVMLKWRDEKGILHRESARTTDKVEARRLLKVKLGKLADGQPNTPGRLTWEQAIELLADNATAKRIKSWSHVATRLRLHLTPHFGHLLMNDITGEMITKFAVGRLRAGAKPAEINRELAVIKRMFRVAVENGRLHHRPLFTMLPEDDNVRQGFFEDDEFAAFLDALPAWMHGPCTLAFFTGWRFHDEVLSLQWKQVDRRTQQLRLFRSKSGSRVISYRMMPALAAVIETAWQEHEALKAEGKIIPHVFHDHGEPLCQLNGREGMRWTSPVRRAWNAARKATGLLEKMPHDFRRTAARNLILAGVSESRAMKITGHKTASVFKRYDIVNTQDVDESFAKLAAANAPAVQKTGTVSPFRTGR